MLEAPSESGRAVRLPSLNDQAFRAHVLCYQLDTISYMVKSLDAAINLSFSGP
jgi:hypothetical protein